MKTIVLQEPGRLVQADTEPPGELQPGQALVRVHRVGICGTDMHAYRGRQPFFTYPRILGHELGVEVLEVRGNGGDAGIAPGDRCAVEPYLNCGRCVACRRGKTNCCVALQCLGVHCDGGLRERIVVPVEKLHKSAQLSLDQLALVETLGIGAHAVDRAAVEPGEWVLVAGAGPIGLGVVQFAAEAGARVAVMDVRRDRLEFCRAQLGVEHAVEAGEHALEEVERITAGDLPTAVFDATGNRDSMQAAPDFVAHGGRLVYVGLVQADITFHDPHFHHRELTILSSRNSTAAEFQRIIRLIERGSIDTRPWITHRASIEGACAALPGWLEPEAGVIKALVEL